MTKIMKALPRTFQDLILTLQRYWAEQGCVLLQPYDMEVGAGTFHTATFLRALGPEPWNAAYVQPSRRPTDGRYGDNPFRLQHYYQFQVVMKPSPDDFIDRYLGSLVALGIDPLIHDIRFVEDNWESPTLGAWGLGWEVWLNGMEVTQFTYFQQAGGLDCRPVMGEITYGLERLAMYLQGVESVFDLLWTDGPAGRVTYGDVFHQNEVEQSAFNFEHADTASLFAEFDQREKNCTAPARGRPAAARLRADAEGLARLQPARCAKGDLGHRAAALHPARARARAGRRRRVLREPRGARLSAAASADCPLGAPMTRHDFLVEIGTEEMPPKSLLALGEAFRDGVVAGLEAAGLSHGAAHAYFTPRRLAVLVLKLLERQPEQRIERRGPPVSAAFDAAGKPTRAAAAFAESCGVKVDELTRIKDNKGEFLFCRTTRAGEQASKLLPGIVRAALDALPIARRMRWGAGDVQFVRPVHWVVMLHGDQVVPGEILGLQAGRMTRGHRFHARKPIALRSPGVYLAALEKGHVRADFDDAARADPRGRRRGGRSGRRCGGHRSCRARRSDRTDGVAGAARGRLRAAIPRPATRSADRDSAGSPALFPGTHEGRAAHAAIRRGRQYRKSGSTAGSRRQRARRASAARGRRILLCRRPQGDSRLPPRGARGRHLPGPTRLAGRQDRPHHGARHPDRAGGGPGPGGGPAGRGTRKCDLLTAMVGEFPELQGVMGRYYALHDGETSEVAAAIAEQYLPRFAGDALPSTGAGLALAIADKLDTLVGIFAIGQKPTGTKDPYGLRRAALGVLRILIETGIGLDLRELIRSALESVSADLARLGKGTFPVPNPAEGLADEIYDYMMERLRAWYLEAPGGVSTEMFDAVLDTRPASPLDFDDRLRALAEFLKLPDAAGLTAANKRIANILRKAGEQPSPRVDPGLLTDPHERQLATEVESLRQDVERLVTARRYADALARLASLRGPLDAFFEHVLVMAEDVRVRANRLALLAALQRLFLHMANLSRLPG